MNISLLSSKKRGASAHKDRVALRHLRQVSRLSIAALVLAILPCPPGIAEEGKFEPLSIVTATGTHDFAVEVMQSQSELEKGLMFRRSMPENHGMLFNFHAEGSVMMWMKNTFIPLDMIFMAKTGRVVGLVANAKPMSERILSTTAPTYAVLELDAGTAVKIDLKIGDMVRHPIFNP